MKYTIISINETRAASKKWIRQVVELPEVTDIPFVNASNPVELNAALERNPTITTRPIWTPKLGELGIWLSQVECWKWAAENGPLVAFEDDALITQHFNYWLDKYLSETPDDYDFFALCVPDNQRQDFNYRVVYDEDGVPKPKLKSSERGYQFDFGARTIARAYQGYCCVATIYSQKGGARLLELAEEFGMYTPVDCFLFLQAHRGNLNAYAPKPQREYAVYVDWNAPTTIHHTEHYKEN